LRKGEVTETLVNNLLNSKDNVAISLLHRNLDEQGRGLVRGALIKKAYDKAYNPKTDEVSTLVFSSELRRLGKTIGKFFTNSDFDNIDGLSKALALTARAEQYNPKASTGIQMTVPAIGAMLGSVFGNTAGAIVGGLSVGGLARMYESKAMRDTLSALSKVPAASAQEQLLLNRFNSMVQITAAEDLVSEFKKQGSQVTFNPRFVKTDKVGDGFVQDDTTTGLRMVSKDGKKFRVFDRNGSTIGIYDSYERAQKQTNDRMLRIMEAEAKSLKNK
jgi:hypothetical protein